MLSDGWKMRVGKKPTKQIALVSGNAAHTCAVQVQLGNTNFLLAPQTAVAWQHQPNNNVSSFTAAASSIPFLLRGNNSCLTYS